MLMKVGVEFRQNDFNSWLFKPRHVGKKQFANNLYDFLFTFTFNNLLDTLIQTIWKVKYKALK